MSPAPERAGKSGRRRQHSVFLALQAGGERAASVALVFCNQHLQAGLFKCELQKSGESRADAEGKDSFV